MGRAVETVCDRIEAMVLPHARRIAVDGITAAGKTTFADHVAGELRRRGTPVARVTMDGYHHPRAVRHRRGRTSAVGYYEDAYDFDSFRQFVLEPLGAPDASGAARYRPAIIDLATDTTLEEEWIEVPATSVVVVDGSFLQKPAVRDEWDLAVFLRTSFAAAEQRGAQRDATALGGLESARIVFRERYHAAQQTYLVDCDPEAAATIVVDVEDPSDPRVVRVSG